MFGNNNAGFAPAERHQLAGLLRDPAAAKAIFHEMRTSYNKLLEQFLEFEEISPDNQELETIIMEINDRRDLNDVLEAIVLNQIRQQEELRKCVDAMISNNAGRLKKLRQEMD